MPQRNGSTKRPAKHGANPNWLKLFKRLPGYCPVKTAKRGMVFDNDAADKACEFFPECLVHVEGEHAGKPFVLDDHQKAIVGCIFGWKRADGTRRFREVFYFVPRKNGKSTLAAGLMLLCMFGDDEPGAQLYSTAAEREQAALVYRIARMMVERNTELSGRVKIMATYKSIEFGDKIYRALSAEAGSKHGLNVHFAVNDELHAHRTGELLEVIQTATGARTQPLIVHITTSDYEREGSVCNQKHEYASRVRDGKTDDAAFLPVVFEAKIEDDWTSPKVWNKANPMLGKSFGFDYMERECERAQSVPSYENTFKRLHLNIRTEQDVRWLSVEHWDKSSGLGSETPVEWRGRMLEELRGQRCFLGLDVSTKVDLTCLMLIFPRYDGEAWAHIPFCWVPESNVHEREHRDKVPFSVWYSQGFVEYTPGNEISQPTIRAKINELASAYDVVEMAYDPWNTVELSRQLREEDGWGDKLVEVRQGPPSLSEPMKRLESMAMSGSVHHGGNPVYRWCISNVAVRMDENENIAPSKKRSFGRIDCVSAAVTGMARALSSTRHESIYETRGVLSL